MSKKKKIDLKEIIDSLNYFKLGNKTLEQAQKVCSQLEEWAKTFEIPPDIGLAIDGGCLSITVGPIQVFDSEECDEECLNFDCCSMEFMEQINMLSSFKEDWRPSNE